MRNLWQQLTGLLPAQRRIIGAVTDYNADGTSTIQTYGGFFRARGQTVPIGQQAEIEGGAVVRQAVTLPTVVIEV